MPFETLDQLEVELTKASSRFQNLKNRSSVPPLITSIAISLLGVALLSGPILMPLSNNRIFMTVGLLTTMIGVLVYPFAYGQREAILGRIRASLDILETRKRIMKGLGEQRSESPPSYFDTLVKINVENLANYYSLVRVQTDKSFVVSVWVGLVGFGFIALSLAFALFFTTRDILSLISAGSGVITEFIAAIFFYLYNQSVRQMRGYFDSLLSVQNILLSFKLVGDTKDEGEKTKMVGQMLAYLIGRGQAGATNAPTDKVT